MLTTLKTFCGICSGQCEHRELSRSVHADEDQMTKSVRLPAFRSCRPSDRPWRCAASPFAASSRVDSVPNSFDARQCRMAASRPEGIAQSGDERDGSLQNTQTICDHSGPHDRHDTRYDNRSPCPKPAEQCAAGQLRMQRQCRYAADKGDRDGFQGVDGCRPRIARLPPTA